MDKIYEPTQNYRYIKPNELLSVVQEKKNDGKRLLQLFASHVLNQYEVIYIFDEGDYKIECVVTYVEKDEELASVSDYYPYACYYEKEAVELFGVKINTGDSFNKLYHIAEETPYVSRYDIR